MAEGFWNGNEFEKSTNEGFATRTTGSFNLNASTQFHGLLPVTFGPIKAFRRFITINKATLGHLIFVFW